MRPRNSFHLSSPPAARRWHQTHVEPVCHRYRTLLELSTWLTIFITVCLKQRWASQHFEKKNCLLDFRGLDLIQLTLAGWSLCQTQCAAAFILIDDLHGCPGTRGTLGRNLGCRNLTFWKRNVMVSVKLVLVERFFVDATMSLMQLCCVNPALIQHSREQ